jgi:hypothetical protein
MNPYYSVQPEELYHDAVESYEAQRELGGPTQVVGDSD